MKQTFETFLQDKHAEQYVGLDDEMPDNFDEWLQDLDPDAWILLGELWGIKRSIATTNELKNVIFNEGATK